MKHYVMTGYFWDEDNCQHEVYVMWTRRLPQNKRDELALKEYKKFRKNNPELNVSQATTLFLEHQLNKVNGVN